MKSSQHLSRSLISLSCFSLACAVALGAIGTHALSSRLTERAMATFSTAQTYHVLHSIGLIIIGLIVGQIGSSRLIRASALLFTIGLVLFSLALYLYALTGFKPLVAFPPFGGVAWIVGWSLLGLGVLRKGPSVTSELQSPS